MRSSPCHYDLILPTGRHSHTLTETLRRILGPWTARARSTIYVRLVDEAVDVWRPARAQPLVEGIYRLASSAVPETETWEFPPGSLVAGEMKELSEGVVLVAVGVPPAG